MWHISIYKNAIITGFDCAKVSFWLGRETKDGDSTYLVLQFASYYWKGDN